MKTLLVGLLAMVTAAWGLALTITAYPENSALLWIIRQEGMTITGLLSISLMSLSMLLATRPSWLEKPLGGLDRMYRLHKWAGILAVALGASHWLIAKFASGLIKGLIGSEGRIPKIRYSGILEALRGLGGDMGEPALYIALAMLAITLWQRIPYHIWRNLHRIMPVLYLMLALHAAMLTPPTYWMQPVGILLGILLSIGVVSSIISLGGLIGRRRRAAGSIVAINTQGDITEITCQLDQHWQGHRPGQFAFVAFDQLESAHPFTIASADRGDRTVTFFIKALGDFTKTLSQRVQTGHAISVEGPYGRFLLDRLYPQRRQIWVAGGIGVSPFLAWLESLQTRADLAPSADLHYCTRDRETDSIIPRLQTLCSTLPNVQLHVHGDKQGEQLTMDSFKLSAKQRPEIWFCGPNGLAIALKKMLKTSWNGSLHFHQEAFELR